MAAKPNRKKRNIHIRSLRDRRGAAANSCQTKTPQQAEIMVAPWPTE
jgi:hypothetical protein